MGVCCMAIMTTLAFRRLKQTFGSLAIWPGVFFAQDLVHEKEHFSACPVERSGHDGDAPVVAAQDPDEDVQVGIGGSGVAGPDVAVDVDLDQLHAVGGVLLTKLDGQLFDRVDLLVMEELPLIFPNLYQTPKIHAHTTIQHSCPDHTHFYSDCC